MKVIVIGATGSIGRLTVKNLLAEGHSVTAFARRPDRVGIEHPDLTLRAGDARDAAAVTPAIRGQDAVVITLGAGASRRNKIRSEGTLAVIRAMQETGVRRLIVQSTLGFWKYIMFGLLLAPAHRDHELQETLVSASGLDWTIVRPSAFTDGPATGQFATGFGPQKRGLSLKIPRADVADFIKRQLSDRGHLHSAVGISN
ncbi:MAG: SDR family oxidoreductase [Maritimibacter sp.]